MDSNRYDYRAVAETTPGTTPTDDSGWVPLPVSDTDTLNARPQLEKSRDLDGSRTPRKSRAVALNVGGGIPFELKAGPFDFLLEALTGGTWASNVLAIGTTKRAFSIEKEAAGLSSGNRFTVYRGMSVASMSLNVAYGQIVRGEFQFQGMDGVYASSSAVGAGSEAAASTKASMVAAAGVSGFQLDSSALSGVVLNGLTLNMTSNLRARTGVDQSLGPAAQNLGTAGVTGELVVYLAENALTLAAAMRDTTDHELDFTIGDGTDSYAFNLPVCQLMGDHARAEGRESDSFLRVGFDLEGDFSITRTIT